MQDEACSKALKTDSYLQELIDAQPMPTRGQYIFVPTKRWRQSFCKRYNLKVERITSKTQYNLDSYLAQTVPALANTFAMRMLYDIKPGTGQIANVDQSMHYRWYDQNKVFKIVR